MLKRTHASHFPNMRDEGDGVFFGVWTGTLSDPARTGAARGLTLSSMDLWWKLPAKHLRCGGRRLRAQRLVLSRVPEAVTRGTRRLMISRN